SPDRYSSKKFLRLFTFIEVGWEFSRIISLLLFTTDVHILLLHSPPTQVADDNGTMLTKSLLFKLS
ncbi:MAG: hypothetical protein J0648_01965, partial [Pelodictyon phaeoclathratiforme]|nr:hypothetical protein [Pelodictyon phaeoclathratiforme]